jgi:hypothetical protein
MDINEYIKKYKEEYNLTKSEEFILKFIAGKAEKLAVDCGGKRVAGISKEVVLEWILESEKATEEPKVKSKVSVISSEQLKETIVDDEAVLSAAEEDETETVENAAEETRNEIEYEEIFLFDPAEYERYVPKRKRK